MADAEKESPVVFPRRLMYLSALVSVICFSLIILHALYPKYQIDTTTIALVVILIFPWLLPYIKTIKLPGGTEIDFKDDVQKLNRLSQKSKGIPSKPMRAFLAVPPTTTLPSLRLMLFQADPSLALASLRIEIETKLREIAVKKNLPSMNERTPLTQILNDLKSKNVLGGTELEMLNIIIDACNRAVHAEKIDPPTAAQIVEIGESALLYLDSIKEKS